MPLYEYRCRSCNAAIELLIRSGETPVCSECESEDLEKLLSGFAVLSSTTAPSHACHGCGDANDCIGNQAAAARARGKAPCC